MRMAAKSAIALILIVCLLLSGVSCAKQSGKQAEENGSTIKRDVDPFGTELFIQVEHTYREGDSLYLLALFPDGQTGFYRSKQAGVLPEIKDLRTGQAKRIILSEYYTDTVESMFRKSVVSGLRMFQSDTSEVAEKANELDGFEILKLYVYPVALRYQPYSITSAQSDYLILQDNNSRVGGAFDPKTGVLYNNVQEGMRFYTPLSALGTKLVGVFSTDTIAVFDTADGSLEKTNVFDRVTFERNGDPWFYQCSNAAFLADGSIAVVITGQAYIETERYEEDRLAILRTDGGTELYDLETPDLNGLLIISNDPNYVIAQSTTLGLAAPRLVNRISGEVAALKVEGTQIVSVPLAEHTDERGNDGQFRFIDVLNDGKTLLVQDGKTGALAIFRPDTMQTNLITIRDESVYFYLDFCGDHNGRLCASSYSREASAEYGILLTIVDKNGDPIF